MKSKPKYYDDLISRAIPYCFRCHKPCEVIETGKDAFIEIS